MAPINQLKLESCDLPMFEWAATAWGFVKAIPRGIQLAHYWREVQIQAQKEIIGARDAQLDARSERLQLADQTQAAQKREIEKLRRELVQMFLEKKRFEEVTPMAVERAVRTAMDWGKEYYSAAAKVELAYRIRNLIHARPEFQNTLKAAVIFAGDVSLVTVQEIRKGLQQVLDSLPAEGDAERLRFRGECERRIEWATSEEKRLTGVLRSFTSEEVKKQS